MKLLQVVGICGGGLGQHVRGLCEGLVGEGHRVTVAYAPHQLDRSFQNFVDERSGDIHFVPMDIRREIAPAPDLRCLLRLVRLIRREGPFDVVHGHSSKAGALARIAGRLSGTPTVYTPNSLIMSSPKISRAESMIYTLIERLLGHLATSKFIAVSEDERRQILEMRLTPADRVSLIENGIDERMLASFSEEGARNHPDDKPLTFGSTMRFEDQKAPGNLMEAFIRLSETMPDFPMRLVVAGDGKLFAQTRKQVEESGFGERISLLGWRNDVGDVLREFDVFVLPSLYEGFSYSLLEAMAAGLPIVSTNVFGARDALSRIDGNMIVPTGDPDALANGMERMAALTENGTRRESLREIGRANHDYVRTHFTQSEVTRRTLEVYEQLRRTNGGAR